MRMRILLWMVGLMVSKVAAQSVDSLGIDNHPTLNKQEIHYLNTVLQQQRDTFDFTNKKIAFVTGSMGTVILSKQDFFLRCVRPWAEADLIPQMSCILLTPAEQQHSNGYDALVFSWVKVVTKKQRNRLVKRLGNQQQSK
jgi:hypothetical protein